MRWIDAVAWPAQFHAQREHATPRREGESEQTFGSAEGPWVRRGGDGVE
jgi:hypothetical protein